MGIRCAKMNFSTNIYESKESHTLAVHHIQIQIQINFIQLCLVIQEHFTTLVKKPLRPLCASLVICSLSISIAWESGRVFSSSGIWHARVVLVIIIISPAPTYHRK